MIRLRRQHLAVNLAGTISVAVLAALTGVAQAQTTASIDKLTGVWVEGPGYDITYGRSYEECAQRCLGTAKCVMIEYYRPEKKCNLYDTVRPRKPGGSSFVGIRK